MLDALPKAAFAVLASSRLLKRLASRYGMRRPNSFARRFIAGEASASCVSSERTRVSSARFLSIFASTARI